MDQTYITPVSYIHIHITLRQDLTRLPFINSTSESFKIARKLKKQKQKQKTLESEKNVPLSPYSCHYGRLSSGPRR